MDRSGGTMLAFSVLFGLSSLIGLICGLLFGRKIWDSWWWTRRSWELVHWAFGEAMSAEVLNLVAIHEFGFSAKTPSEAALFVLIPLWSPIVMLWVGWRWYIFSVRR